VFFEMKKLPLGKIHMDILERLLADYTHGDNRVVVGSGIGEDAAVIDMGDSYLIAKTDPITSATDEIGYYVVNINANDIAAMGGTPRWFLATVLVPKGTGAPDLDRIFGQISESCRNLGIAYCGGHTEVTSSVTSVVVVGQMLGEAAKTKLKPSSAAREGDHLLMTKSAAIEATSLIAREKEHELEAVFMKTYLTKAKNFLSAPGISVVKDAAIVIKVKGVHALHDPTEGGIATGIFEMARASGLGVEVAHKDIPVRKETQRLCSFYGVDPLGCFASGSLLIATSPESSAEVIEKLSASDIPAKRIGTMMPAGKGMTLIRNGSKEPLPVYHQDELSRILV
jgi:hydrogenase maturation factor